MPTIIDNFQWMGWNVALAIIPIFFTYLIIKYSKQHIASLFIGLWILFFPNTIYLVTDIQYLPNQLSRTMVSADILLIFQYMVLVGLGLITYFLSLSPIIKKFKINGKIVFVFNFVVSFAVALGKIQRTESWDIITNPIRVLNDVNRSLSSPQIILFVIGFGLLINLIFISGRMYFNDRVRS